MTSATKDDFPGAVRTSPAIERIVLHAFYLIGGIRREDLKDVEACEYHINVALRDLGFEESKVIQLHDTIQRWRGILHDCAYRGTLFEPDKMIRPMRFSKIIGDSEFWKAIIGGEAVKRRPAALALFSLEKVFYHLAKGTSFETIEFAFVEDALCNREDCDERKKDFQHETRLLSRMIANARHVGGREEAVKAIGKAPPVEKVSGSLDDVREAFSKPREKKAEPTPARELSTVAADGACPKCGHVGGGVDSSREGTVLGFTGPIYKVHCDSCGNDYEMPEVMLHDKMKELTREGEPPVHPSCRTYVDLDPHDPGSFPGPGVKVDSDKSKIV